MAQQLEILEKTVQNAGTQLDNVVEKLVEVENNLSDDADDTAILELLESMTEVKNEYQNLKKDILEVQVLQREMQNSLRLQMKVTTQTFYLLKKRIQKKLSQN